MNLAQFVSVKPVASINMTLPDMKLWDSTVDQQRDRKKKELIAETLIELKMILTYEMSVAQIRELMPESSSKIKDWMRVWTNQGHLNSRRVGGIFLYSLKK
jgi:hypothetical protein